MTEPCPSPVRALALMALAGALGVALWALPLAHPPADPTALPAWWGAVGTDAAVAAGLRVLAAGLTAWVAASGLLGVIVGARRSAVVFRLWVACTPSAVRRALAASAVSAVVAVPTIAAPGVAAAAEPSVPPAVLVDLGPADAVQPEPGPVLVDIGPSRVEAAPVSPSPSAPPSDTDTWVVQPGDHLWHIAEETLVDRNRPADERTIRAYWARVIDENRAAIGDDVDLIHPGLVLQLPQ